ETVAEAVDDARRNARLNGILNAHFELGKAEDILPQWQKDGFKPDVIVVDPPRSGCDEQLLQTIHRIKPRKFVYVSCNPSTLAKDCSFLMKRGWKLKSLQPVDMFPQTAHVECVAWLTRN